MGSYAILKDKKVVPIHDVLEWAPWMETADRSVANDYVGKVRVSTAFLGLDHSFLGDNEPLWFETMIFGGKHDGYQERYETYEQAEAGHKLALELVNASK